MCNLSRRTENQEDTSSFFGVITLVACAADNPQPTAEPAVIEILPLIDSIFINEAVDDLLVDIKTIEPVERASGAWPATTMCPATEA